jgi:hypothetical protein
MKNEFLEKSEAPDARTIEFMEERIRHTPVLGQEDILYGDFFDSQEPEVRAATNIREFQRKWEEAQRNNPRVRKLAA